MAGACAGVFASPGLTQEEHLRDCCQPEATIVRDGDGSDPESVGDGGKAGRSLEHALAFPSLPGSGFVEVESSFYPLFIGEKLRYQSFVTWWQS